MTSAREIHLNSIADDINASIDTIVDKFCYDPEVKLSSKQAELMTELLNLYKHQVDTMYEVSFNRLSNPSEL